MPSSPPIYDCSGHGPSSSTSHHIYPLFCGWLAQVPFSFLKCYIFILFLAMLGLCCCVGLSLVAVCGLLIVMASLAAAPRLLSTGSVVVAHGLSCSTSCGIFLDQTLNQCLLHWQADSLSMSQQGSPSGPLFYSQSSCLPWGTFCFLIQWTRLLRTLIGKPTSS